MIIGMHHVAIAVIDLERMLAFYRDIAGFRVVHEGAWQPGNARIDALTGLHDSSAGFVVLHGGNCYLELFQYSSPTPRPNDPDRPVSDAGITHVCLVSDDIDAEYRRMGDAGIRFHAPPGPPGAMRATYGRDPEGNVFELIAFGGGDHPFAFDKLTLPHA